MVNISRIDLNLFVVFDAIYTDGNITRASESLRLTQPAVSHALKRLRDLVGDPLFVRKGHAMEPTAVAKELIEPVRRAIGDIESSLSKLSAFDPATSRREFRIGTRPYVEAALIPDLMLRIAQVAPGVRIASEHHNRTDFQSELGTGALAAVVDVLLPLGHSIRKQRLDGGSMVVVARRGHPVVQGGISLDDYLRQDHVLASSRRTGPGMEDMELARQGFQRRIKLRCQNYWTACKLVSNSDILLTMPEHYAKAANETLDNQLVAFPIPMSTRDIYLYWHANVQDDPANQWLRDNILAVFNVASTQR